MSPEEFDNEVSQLEINLDRLRALYEQYFLGIERIEPAVARKTVDRQFWALKRVTMRNTARRFRFQTLVQRYNTLQQHWMKVCRQIENGTYPRHVKRAKQRIEEPSLTRKSTARGREESTDRQADAPEATVDPAALVSPEPGHPTSAPTERDPLEVAPAQPMTAPQPARPLPPPRRKKPELPAAARGTPTSEPSSRSSRPSRRISLQPISDHDAKKIRSSIPPAPAVPRGTPPRREVKNPHMNAQSTAAQNITDERVDGLYQELQRVRRRLNQDEMDVSMEALSRSLRATEARLKAKYAGKRVDFRVEVFNGKAVIKPTVKK